MLKIKDVTGYKDIRQVENQCKQEYGDNAGFVVFYADKAGFSDGATAYPNITSESEIAYSDSRLSGAFGNVKFAGTATAQTKEIAKNILTSANFVSQVF